MEVKEKVTCYVTLIDAVVNQRRGLNLLAEPVASSGADEAFLFDGPDLGVPGASSSATASSSCTTSTSMLSDLDFSFVARLPGLNWGVEPRWSSDNT